MVRATKPSAGRGGVSSAAVWWRYSASGGGECSPTRPTERLARQSRPAAHSGSRSVVSLRQDARRATHRESPLVATGMGSVAGVAVRHGGSMRCCPTAAGSTDCRRGPCPTLWRRPAGGISGPAARWCRGSPASLAPNCGSPKRSFTSTSTMRWAPGTPGRASTACNGLGQPAADCRRCASRTTECSFCGSRTRVTPRRSTTWPKSPADRASHCRSRRCSCRRRPRVRRSRSGPSRRATALRSWLPMAG